MTNVLELVHAHLEPRGGTKAAEERGMCFGKGFALLSLVCSGVLFTAVSRDTPSRTNNMSRCNAPHRKTLSV